MIGRFIVAIVTNSKHWRHDYVCYVTKYLVPSLTSMGCSTLKLEMFQYLANQKHCYVTMATNV